MLDFSHLFWRASSLAPSQRQSFRDKSVIVLVNLLVNKHSKICGEQFIIVSHGSVDWISWADLSWGCKSDRQGPGLELSKGFSRLDVQDGALSG